MARTPKPTPLDFALSCGYISPPQHAKLTAMSHEVGKMLGAMLNAPDKFLLKL